MEWFLAYLLLGGVAGFLGGMFGVGGGTVLVPVLLMLFEAQHFPAAHTMHLALGSSMAVILFTSIASMRKHHQHGAVIWRVVFSISPGILLGTAIGSLVAASISPYFLTIFFALFMYFAATQILLNAAPHAARQLPGIAGMTLMGTITGWVSTLVSVGGGTLTVPQFGLCLSTRHAELRARQRHHRPTWCQNCASHQCHFDAKIFCGAVAGTGDEVAVESVGLMLQ